MKQVNSKFEQTNCKLDLIMNKRQERIYQSLQSHVSLIHDEQIQETIKIAFTIEY